MRSSIFTRWLGRGALAFGAWGLLTMSAHAVTITSVMAPDLTRPNNGRLFPFTFTSRMPGVGPGDTMLLGGGLLGVAGRRARRSSKE